MGPSRGVCEHTCMSGVSPPTSFGGGGNGKFGNFFFYRKRRGREGRRAPPVVHMCRATFRSPPPPRPVNRVGSSGRGSRRVGADEWGLPSCRTMYAQVKKNRKLENEAMGGSCTACTLDGSVAGADARRPGALQPAAHATISISPNEAAAASRGAGELGIHHAGQREKGGTDKR
ncbi:unnamed protein product [Lampetra fluviatilis]